MTATTKQQQLPLSPAESDIQSEGERQVIMTANGSERASETVYRTGALVGMESLNIRPPENIPVEFVDWPFTQSETFDELWDRHLRVVKAERPRYAVAPDVVGDLLLQDALDYADELAQYADTVIVVPKNCHPSAVPDEYRTGMPCQPRFGKPPWSWPDYQECDSVHLLGGSPVVHQKILKYYVNVESVDSAAPLRAAQFGSYWNGQKWVEVEGDEQFYRCVKNSYSAMRRSMNPDRRVWCPRPRNRRLDYESAFKELDDTGLFDHSEELPRPPREAYYVCDSPRELAEYVLGEIK